MSEIQHTDIPIGYIHPIVQWIYASEAARIASTGYLPADLHKISYVTETSQYWALVSISPNAWVSLGGSGGGGSTSLGFTRNAVTVTVTSSSGGPAVLPAADSGLGLAGVMSSAQAAKLAGIATGAQVNVNADWVAVSGISQILNKPSTFPASAHAHAISDVTGLSAALTSGRITSGTGAINFGSGQDIATLIITAQADITVGAAVNAWIRPVATGAHSIDEHLIEQLDLHCHTIVAGVGFTITAVARNFPLFGSWNLSWQWANL